MITKGGGTTRTTGVFTVLAAVPQVGDIQPRFAAPGSKVRLSALPGTRFEALRSVRFLADPDAVGRARRIVLGPTEFSVSGDMTRIDVLVPLGAVTGKVRVTNDSGASVSPVLRVPLASPGLLVARSAQGPQVQLSWRDTTTTEAGFRLERSNGEFDGAYSVIATLAPNTVSYVDNSVTAGSTYRYRLVAFNGIEGDSAPSNAAVITVGTSVQLNPVRMLFAAVRDSASPSPQALSITRPADATAEVAWSTGDDMPWLSVLPGSGNTPGTAMVAIDTFGLKAGRYIGVVTVRSGTTVATEPVELTVAAPPGAITIVIDPE